MSVTLSTTGLISSVTINDFGGRTFIHPVVNEEISLEFTYSEIRTSSSIGNALDSGYITIFNNGIQVNNSSDLLKIQPEPALTYQGQGLFKGEEWINISESITNILNQNVWQSLILTTTSRSLQAFSQSNGVFTYNGVEPADIIIFLTLNIAGKPNDSVEFDIVKEDTLLTQTSLLSRKVTIGGSVGNIKPSLASITTTANISSGDKIKVNVRNNSGKSNITILPESNCVIGIN